MAQYTNVGGVARRVTKRYEKIGGVAKNVLKAYNNVSGVARRYFNAVLRLERSAHDNRNAEIFTYTEEDSVLYAKAKGGSGTDYTTIRWIISDDLKPGDVVRFSFNGSASGNYSGYGIVFWPSGISIGEAYNAALYKKVNSNAVNSEYTVTEACQAMFYCQIGGENLATIFAEISITDFQINGERIWV